MGNWLERTELLIGSENQEKLKNKPDVKKTTFNKPDILKKFIKPNDNSKKDIYDEE